MSHHRIIYNFALMDLYGPMDVKFEWLQSNDHILIYMYRYIYIRIYTHTHYISSAISIWYHLLHLCSCRSSTVSISSMKENPPPSCVTLNLSTSVPLCGASIHNLYPTGQNATEVSLRENDMNSKQWLAAGQQNRTIFIHQKWSTQNPKLDQLQIRWLWNFQPLWWCLKKHRKT